MADEVVAVEVPASLRYLRVVRMVTAAVASLSGLAHEDVEDVRVAVSELAHALMEQAPASGRLSVQFRVAVDEISVSGQVPGAGPPVLDDLTAQILVAAADSVQLTGDGGCQFWMTRSLTRAHAGLR